MAVVVHRMVSWQASCIAVGQNCQAGMCSSSTSTGGTSALSRLPPPSARAARIRCAAAARAMPRGAPVPALGPLPCAWGQECAAHLASARAAPAGSSGRAHRARTARLRAPGVPQCVFWGALGADRLTCDVCARRNGRRTEHPGWHPQGRLEARPPGLPGQLRHEQRAVQDWCAAQTAACRRVPHASAASGARSAAIRRPGSARGCEHARARAGACLGPLGSAWVCAVWAQQIPTSARQRLFGCAPTRPTAASAAACARRVPAGCQPARSRRFGRALLPTLVVQLTTS